MESNNITRLEDIKSNFIGKTIKVSGVIDSICQTEGPTLFTLVDGSGSFTLEGFKEAGKRAYPEIEDKDAIQGVIKIKEYQGSFEGEILKIKKIQGKEGQIIIDRIEKEKRKKAEPPTKKFLVESEILEKLKSRFIKAATEIRLAIIDNRPIIVRHHNDVDGYSSGFALEKAIVPLVQKQHNSPKSRWEFFTRAPCTAPFYEIDDSIRDSSLSLRNVAKFSNKMPLVIIADNGSSEDDLMPIQQGKIHGMEFIVIDHHYFDEDVISSEVLSHINPFLVGESGSKYSAGMLCTELARFINPQVENIFQIPAMAGMADKTDNPKAMEQYLRLAKKEGYSEKLSKDIGVVIDFVSAKLRFMEAREYIEVLFGEPRNQQTELVKLMAPYIKNLENKGLSIARSAASQEEINGILFQPMFIEENFPGFGFYPKPGKATGILHDYTLNTKGIEENKKGNKKVVTAGILSSAITMRASDEANFSIHKLIKRLNEKIPEAFVEGGGHKNAGAINFIPSTREKVLKEFREYLKDIK